MQRLPQSQNCRSLIVAPDGTIAAQSELKTEQLVVADIDPALASRVMFHLGEEAVAGQAASEDSTELLRTPHW